MERTLPVIVQEWKVEAWENLQSDQIKGWTSNCIISNNDLQIKKDMLSSREFFEARAKYFFWPHLLYIYFSERVGFEPTVTCATLVFKTNTLNHSDTSPYFLTYQKQGADASPCLRSVHKMMCGHGPEGRHGVTLSYVTNHFIRNVRGIRCSILSNFYFTC